MKKKMLEFGMAVVLLFCAFLISRKGAAVTVNSTKVKTETNKEMGKETIEEKKIVIDAGHGGSDPGKVGINGAKEKDINLQIAQKLKKALEDRGYKIIMTRESDAGLYSSGASNKKVEDMQKRVQMIAETNPLLTISIHQNSYGEESVHGPQIFYFSHSDKAKDLAEILQEALNTGMTVDRPRVAKANDNYYLLKKTSCPTVIVECGFLSNRAEADKLIKEEYQEQLVENIVKGVDTYAGDSDR
jgi:N-acetylmuramoyl-L-alanine amidase